MKFTGFMIYKYKAVKEVYLSLRNNLIPIIGINESGKTSVLHAILAFDKFNDWQLNKNHLEAKNRYDYDSSGHIIGADVVFDDTWEQKQFLNKIEARKRKSVQIELEKILQDGGKIRICRNLDNKEYYIENLPLLKSSSIAIDFILDKTPFILLFDDFTDRVPEKIIFPSNYVSDEYIDDEDTTRTDWHSFIEEIFLRATNNSLTDYLKTPKKVDKEGILSDVTDILNQDIIEGWKKLKILGKELNAEKISDLKLTLSEDMDGAGNFIFTFNVIDKNFKGKGRFFHVTERSKGFQWFFNFAIKLKYNPKYQNDVDGAIYLLDEPGSYLHSSAQDELLKSLKEISKTNKVIYCTHSQYLLNPEIINVANVKIASRNGGVISFINFNEYAESDGSQGALSPLYDALHLNIAKHDFPREQNIILTEGIIDFYFINMIKKHSSIFCQMDFSVIPGAGVDNLRDLISFCISWSKSYTVIFDSDSQGNHAFEKYKDFFEDSESRRWIKYSLTAGKRTNVKLEDLLSKNDKDKIKEMTGSSSVKKGIISLYFSRDEEQRIFVNSMDEFTKDNISKLSDEIISKLSHH